MYCWILISITLVYCVKISKRNLCYHGRVYVSHVWKNDDLLIRRHLLFVIFQLYTFILINVICWRDFKNSAFKIKTKKRYDIRRRPVPMESVLHKYLLFFCVYVEDGMVILNYIICFWFKSELASLNPSYHLITKTVITINSLV